MMWVMMWAMMWATGTMAATMPAKGMMGTPARRGGGGAPGRGRGSGGSGDGSGSGNGSGGGCLLQGSLIFIVKIFLCGIFMMCGGNWRGHTSPHTLVMLEVCTYPGGLAKIFCSNVNTYKVDTRQKKHIFTKDVVGFLLGEVISTRKTTSSQSMW
jgi:hypothetical protein